MGTVNESVFHQDALPIFHADWSRPIRWRRIVVGSQYGEFVVGEIMYCPHSDFQVGEWVQQWAGFGCGERVVLN